MSAGGDPDAWLGLLKWSLAHQDGTQPSEARPMSDEDRAWLEKVVAEGVRDDFKVMTGIYGRLCAYLDHAATSPARTPTADTGASPPPIGGVTPAVSPSAEPAQATAAAVAPPLPVPAAGESAVLSTFVAASPPPPAAAAAVAVGVGAGGDGGVGGVGGLGTEEEQEMVEGVMNDLEELQEIVEQIDMAATFAKIGGFGRLIALVAPKGRPEKLRLLAASVIGTLTKNNPPAQASFASSGGHRALLQAGIAASAADETMRLTTATSGSPSSASAEQETSSLALRRAILHALSSSVMGLAEGESALCSEPGFQEFLARALSQGGGGRGGEDGGRMNEETSKLRSKAAFVLKALVSSPEATQGRVEALWPAVKGLLTGLEALTEREGGVGDDAAASLETCIEALVAAGRSLDGDRVVRELGPRVSRVIARRRQALVEARQGGALREGDAESAEFELGLWSEWENLTGPPQ